LKLTWIDNSPNETGFALERRGSMDPFAQIAVVGPNVTSFADSGLTPGATYCYRVRAFNSAGWSPYTNEACGIATDMLSVGLNASAFTVGQTVAGSITVNNPGLPTTVDFFLGLLMPNGHTIALLTSGGFAIGDAGVPTSLRSVAHSVSLGTPFSVT